MEEGLTRKAELILGGPVRIPDDVRLPQPSPAEPPCPDTVVLEFDGLRVRTGISQSEGDLEIRMESRKRMSLYRGDEVVVPDISLGTPNRGCEQQLVIDMSGGLSPEDAAMMAERTASRRKVKSISFTARTVDGIDDAVGRIAEAAKTVRWLVPKGAIGVEAWLTSMDQVRTLRDAGINELKIDLGCVRDDIFEKVYPDRNYDAVIDMLRDAGDVFKKGKLASDLYYGLGESDQDIDMMLERLCRMNVIPVLRLPRPEDAGRITASGIPIERPSVLRSVFLCGLEKSAMKRHGIDPSKFHSMCMSCGACILVPFRDLRYPLSFSSLAPAARRSCICSPAWALRTWGTASERNLEGPPPAEA